MLTAGQSNRWIADDRWHDVSYFGSQPFGLGVIAQSLPGALLYGFR